MAITPTVIKGERREEFGKGSARRLRREGKIPGVLYEKGIDNIHFAVDRIEMTAVVRNDGTNAIVELELDGEKLLMAGGKRVVKVLLVAAIGLPARSVTSAVAKASSAPSSAAMRSSNIRTVGLP